MATCWATPQPLAFSQRRESIIVGPHFRPYGPVAEDLLVEVRSPTCCAPIPAPDIVQGTWSAAISFFFLCCLFFPLEPPSLTLSLTHTTHTTHQDRPATFRPLGVDLHSPAPPLSTSGHDHPFLDKDHPYNYADTPTTSPPRPVHVRPAAALPPLPRWYSNHIGRLNVFYYSLVIFCSSTTSSRDGRARLPALHGEPPTTAADQPPSRSSGAHGHALALDLSGFGLCATAHGSIVATAPPSHSAAAAGLALCVATAPATRPHHRRSLPGPGPGAAQPLRRQRRRSTPA